jgi:putative oxidoreductase
MTDGSLVIPQFGAFYGLLSPYAEALLRAVIGLALIPHGLRNCFGFFPNTGGPVRGLPMLAGALDRWGYPPGWLWAPVIVITQLVGGPLLAVGLFTRPIALTVAIFLFMSTYERARVGGYFWNTQGLEFPLMWFVGALYFVMHGGGVYSLDRALLGWEF